MMEEHLRPHATSQSGGLDQTCWVAHARLDLETLLGRKSCHLAIRVHLLDGHAAVLQREARLADPIVDLMAAVYAGKQEQEEADASPIDHLAQRPAKHVSVAADSKVVPDELARPWRSLAGQAT